MASTILVLIALAQSAQRPVPVPPSPQIIAGVPAAVLDSEKAWAGADVFLPMLRSGDQTVRHYALRALGRLEDPRIVPQLLAFAEQSEPSRPDVANAIAQSLHGFDPRTDPELIARVFAWLHKMAYVERPEDAVPYAMPLGRIAYTTAEQVHGAEEILRYLMDSTGNSQRLEQIYMNAARAMESLARLNRTLGKLDEETVVRLNRMVRGTWLNDHHATVRADALRALAAGGTVDPDTEKAALQDEDWDVHRGAVALLAGSGGGLDDEARVSAIADALKDGSPQVRYDALKAYMRRAVTTRGCAPLLDLLDDPDSHVSLAVIDALGPACKDDETLTERILPEVRTPALQGPWQRPTHAFVALAKRAPEAAAISMEAFATHPVWWVRLYAIQAAVAMKDLARLEKLAYDPNDNVREAALQPLRRLAPESADAAIVAALQRADYQLLRTAAILLKESPPNRKLCVPLIDALRRVTREGKETSRDVRLALLDAIAAHARADDVTALLPLVKDSDPKVAQRTAELLSQLTGKTINAEPAPVGRGWAQEFRNLHQCIRVSLTSGKQFDLEMLPEAAPITVDHFMKLADRDHYYDGLTFHRVVPNFIVQGGSPGANEYSGAKDYMRDEIGSSNTRGTVGLSTRGRNTGDAQFYINLVDNTRLDGDYTVFARALDMSAVGEIEEGEEILRMRLAPSCPKK